MHMNMDASTEADGTSPEHFISKTEECIYLSDLSDADSVRKENSSTTEFDELFDDYEDMNSSDYKSHSFLNFTLENSPLGNKEFGKLVTNKLDFSDSIDLIVMFVVWIVSLFVLLRFTPWVESIRALIEYTVYLILLPIVGFGVLHFFEVKTKNDKRIDVQ